MAFRTPESCLTSETCALFSMCADAHSGKQHVNEIEARTDEMDLQLHGLNCQHPQMQEVRRRAAELKKQIADQDSRN